MVNEEARTPMALTDTDLQVVVEHVKRMLPAMLIETAPLSHLQGDAPATVPGNYAEEHLARFEERTAQEFKALRELMQAGFAAVDKRFEDMNKRFEDMNKRFEDMNKRFTAIQWMGTVAFVVLGVIISVVGLS